MAAQDDEDEDETDDLRLPARRTDHEMLMLLLNRTRDINKRLRKIEKKQGDIDALLNKVLGGAALITGLGVFLGWLFSMGQNALRFFGR